MCWSKTAAEQLSITHLARSRKRKGMESHNQFCSSCHNTDII